MNHRKDFQDKKNVGAMIVWFSGGKKGVAASSPAAFGVVRQTKWRFRNCCIKAFSESFFRTFAEWQMEEKQLSFEVVECKEVNTTRKNRARSNKTREKRKTKN